MLLCAGLILWLMLPTLTQRVVVPWLGARLGLPGLRMDVRRLDLAGLDLGDISLGPSSGVRIRAAQLDWSLTGLAGGRLDTVRILGLEIQARHENGTWRVAGLPMGATNGNSTPLLPRIDALHVDGRITLESAFLNLDAPFRVTGALEENGRVTLDARTALAGQEFRTQLQAELPEKKFRLTCALPPASVAALASTIPALRDLAMGGSLEALADMTLASNQTPRIDANLDLQKFRTLLGDTPLTQGDNASLDLTWVEDIHATLGPIRLDAPIPLTLTVRDPHFDPKSGRGAAAWDIAIDGLPGLRLAPPPRLTGTTEVAPSPTGWDIRTHAELPPIQAEFENQTALRAILAASNVVLDLTANATDQNLNASLNLGDARLEQSGRRAALTGLNLHGNATNGPGGTTGALSLTGARLEAAQPGLTFTTSNLGGNCTFAWGPEPRAEGALALTARATAGDASALVSLDLPLSWPIPGQKPGKAAIALSHKAKAVGAVTSTVRQTESGLRLDGALALTPVTVRGAITGQLDMRAPEASWVQVKIGQKLAFPGQLARFAPAMGSLTGTARLDALVRLDASQGQPRCPASLHLRDIELNHGKTATTLGNANLALAFPDLLAARSDPDQRLTFGRLRLGSVALDQGDIRFQIEAPHSVLVERCGFRWAGGRIGSHAFRVNPGVEEYTVELHCDRVQLTQALEQLGMSQVQGGGTANGRIPVRYAHGSISFDDGFLYSTPGEKGVLRIQGADILTAGVPPDSPQYAQLDLAAEALKDFNYDWARISLDTKGQELLVSLQLDGKPAKPLPFTFNRDIGGFARVTSASAGSTFQGIRLDANFRLPLDQLLRYRQLLDLFKNGG